MITDKQFRAYIEHIERLRYDGNDVYIHGKKVVKTSLAGDVGREFNWFGSENKIWTKGPNDDKYVVYTKQSFNNDTKLNRLYDVTQTLKNDYTYMEAKLALKKYEERYGAQSGGDGYTIRYDGSPT